MLSRVGDHVGFSICTLQHESDSIEQELLIDTRCGLELLLQQSIADQLHLVPVPGRDICVTGVGGTVTAVPFNGMDCLLALHLLT